MTTALTISRTAHRLIFFMIVVCVVACSLGSCRVIRANVAMRRKTPKEKTIRLDNKDIRFIPIVHFGQKEFYRKLKDKLVAYKAAGYKVYYEQTMMSFDEQHTSRAAYDTVRRKFRKMTGGQGHTRNDYKQEFGGLFKKMQVQPTYEWLGITASDVNADVTIVQMTNEYERLYGSVLLSACDITTPLDAPYSCDRLHNSMLPIIRTCRNRNLAAKLSHAPEHKILVLYGGNHFRPVKRLLKRHSFE